MTETRVASRIRLDPEVLRDFCHRHHIAKLSLYGSVVRADFRPNSDVDVLVEFEPGHTPGLFRLGGMALDLEDMIGRAVDLKTLGDFPPHVRGAVVAGSQVLYAAE